MCDSDCPKCSDEHFAIFAKCYGVNLSAPEPAPKPNNHPAVWDLVIADMQQRDKMGAEKYGTRLQPFKGRDFLVDQYQEFLDAAVYTRGKIYERDNPDVSDDPRRELAYNHAAAMFRVLNLPKNREKGDNWQQLDVYDLLADLRSEINEFWGAVCAHVHSGRPIEYVVNEGADISNVVAMIVDNLKSASR